jgi:hypothetical protein
LYLMSFLEEAFYQQDVRQSVRDAFKLSQLTLINSGIKQDP